MTALGQASTDIIEQLGRERTGTHARGVCLGDTENVIQIQRTEARTGGSAAGSGAGAGNVGIGAMVDVQQRALRALEHDAGTLLAQLVQAGGDIGDQRLEDFRVAERLI